MWRTARIGVMFKLCWGQQMQEGLYCTFVGTVAIGDLPEYRVYVPFVSGVLPHTVRQPLVMR